MLTGSSFVATPVVITVYRVAQNKVGDFIFILYTMYMTRTRKVKVTQGLSTIFVQLTN